MGDESKVFGSDGNEEKSGCPECFGQHRQGRRCNCRWEQACTFYFYDNEALISRQRKWDEYQTVPILEGVDWTNEEASLSAFNGLFQNGFGENIDPSEINMQLIKLFVWMTIENPSAARAFMIKLDPDVRSLQDIAERLGVTKQAVQKRVAAELGIGKRNYRDSDFLKLRGRELDVYKLVMCDGVSLGSAAMQIGISKTQVRNLVKKLEKMGYKYRKDIK